MNEKIYTRNFTFALIFGFGYWRDSYSEKKIGIGGIQHNLILPFMKIQWGYLFKPQKSNSPLSKITHYLE